MLDISFVHAHSSSATNTSDRPLFYNATITTMPTITKASTLCFDPSVGAALCELEVVEEPPLTAFATKVPTAVVVITCVVVTPASTSVFVTVAVVVVKPDRPSVAVTVYHPLGPTPPHPGPPGRQSAEPPHGPHPLVQEAVFVAQLE